MLRPNIENKIMDLFANFANAWPDAPLDDDIFKWQVIVAAVVVLSLDARRSQGSKLDGGRSAHKDSLLRH